MRRTNWKTVSTLVTMGLLAGCMDNTISAPRSAAVAPVVVMSVPQSPLLSQSGSNNSKSSRQGDNSSADFTVGGSGGWFVVGEQVIYFPSRSICNPAKSSYGLGKWDDKCTALDGSIKIHAEVRTVNGKTTVDFSPALRFVPSNDPSDWVMIYMWTPGAKTAKDLSRFNILYTTSIGGAEIDETVQDASLRTYVNRYVGISYRRIKHFSGYTSSGFYSDCTPGMDEDCYESPGGGGIGGGGR